jgi:hypothetical protein
MLTLTTTKLQQRKRKQPNEAFLLGVQDFKRGQTRNPYKPKAYYHKEWERGFNYAYHQNLAICA